MGTMKLDTVRFGSIEVEEKDLIEFPRGLIGFEQLRRFVVLEGPEGTPLRWLQSVEEPGLAFVVADPRVFMPEYVARAKADDLVPVALEGPHDAAVAVILTVPGDLSRATAKLLGPIVFNVDKRLGAQVIVEGDYPVRYPLFSRFEEARDADSKA